MAPRWRSINFILLFVLVAAGCNRGPSTPTAAPSATEPTPVAATHTPIPPTPTSTPEPLAVIVNGEEISLEEYQIDLLQVQAVSGTDLASEMEGIALDALIDRVLLAQAAAKAGFSLDEAALDERIAGLEAEAGGAEALQTWMEANGYTAETFRRALRRSAAAAWMRDQIASGVAETAEQVHARQLLFSDRGAAESALAQIQAGVDFENLAKENDPVGGGDLGWFSRGVLTQPELDEVAFALQPGEVSSIVDTQLGFHILQVIERDPDRQLDAGMRLALQEQAVAGWLREQRESSEIRVLIPEN